jgi:hypothetical protein
MSGAANNPANKSLRFIVPFPYEFLELSVMGLWLIDVISTFCNAKHTAV